MAISVGKEPGKSSVIDEASNIERQSFQEWSDVMATKSPYGIEEGDWGDEDWKTELASCNIVLGQIDALPT